MSPNEGLVLPAFQENKGSHPTTIRDFFTTWFTVVLFCLLAEESAVKNPPLEKYTSHIMHAIYLFLQYKAVLLINKSAISSETYY